MKTACKLAGLLALATLSALQAQDARGYFNLFGPMDGLLRPGVQPAPVSGGLPFAVVLSSGGAPAFPSSFLLQGKGWAGSLELRFEELRFAGGQVTGKAVLRNGTGQVLAGLRLDVTGASEEYKAREADGKSSVRTREQKVAMAAPLLFGDLPAGQASDPVPLTVRGVAFQPETERVTLQGVVSGLAFLGSAAISEITPDAFNADGRVYVLQGYDEGHLLMFQPF